MQRDVGRLNFSSASIGGAAHIAMAAFNVQPVPNDYVPLAARRLGQVQAIISQQRCGWGCHSGALRALRLGSPKRIGRGAGHSRPSPKRLRGGDVGAASYGIVAPASTSSSNRVQRFYSEIRRAMASPEITRRRLNNEGAEHQMLFFSREFAQLYYE